MTTPQARAVLGSDARRESANGLCAAFAAWLPRLGLAKDHRVYVTRMDHAWCVLIERRDGAPLHPTPEFRAAVERLARAAAQKGG